ncbi:hypothetical protein B0H14DRAFT_2654296 [Mycena olivaceomarginata]|nr:hypothetical protein B0H14DRAFT_2654296 [Mycena olivaceomarginata]
MALFAGYTEPFCYRERSVPFADTFTIDSAHSFNDNHQVLFYIEKNGLLYDRGEPSTREDARIILTVGGRRRHHTGAYDRLLRRERDLADGITERERHGISLVGVRGSRHNVLPLKHPVSSLRTDGRERSPEPLDLILSAGDDLITPFTPRKDKALKREAMHLEDGEPATGRLETWLEHYRPTDHDAQKQRTELLKRTELVAHAAARKAAQKHRLERTRVLYTSAHKWPRRSDLPLQSKNVERRMKERREEQEYLAQANTRAWALAAGRVQHLLTPRSEAMRGGARIFRKRF